MRGRKLRLSRPGWGSVEEWKLVEARKAVEARKSEVAEGQLWEGILR